MRILGIVGILLSILQLAISAFLIIGLRSKVSVPGGGEMLIVVALVFSIPLFFLVMSTVVIMRSGKSKSEG